MENIEESLEDLEGVFQAEDSSHVFINPDPEASKPTPSLDYAENVVSSIETEFNNMANSSENRRLHKEELTKKLAELTKKLRQTKNIKNHKMRTQNAAIAKKRKDLKEQIEAVKDDLYAINMEEAGEDVSSTSLVDASLTSNKETKPVPDPSKPASFITANNSNLFGSGGVADINTYLGKPPGNLKF